MQCGAENFACHLVKWVFADGEVSTTVIEVVATILNGTHPVFSFAAGLLYEHASKIAAFLTGIFAIYKWYNYRESVLHQRLAEYIRESSDRLIPSRDAVIELIDRPDRRNTARTPSFAPELKGLLKDHGWAAAAYVAQPYNRLEGKLRETDKALIDRINAADKAIALLKEQRVAVYVIKGALASAKAAACRDRESAMPYVMAASSAYKHALDLQTPTPSAVILEGHLIQLMRVQKYDAALETLENLRDASKAVSDKRTATFLQSRCERYHALILKATGRPQAYNRSQSATALRTPYPASNWDEIEQAEFHLTNAYLTPANFHIRRQNEIDRAAECYSRVLSHLPRWRRPLLYTKRRIWNAAIQGRRRLERLSANRLNDRDLDYFFQPPATRPSDQP